MTTVEEKDPFDQLKEKMINELQGGHPYEAFQLAMSLVARKKKQLGRSTTSALVFHATSILLENNASSEAGSLLSWFIEDGAGDDYYFKLEENMTAENYCDSQRLINLMASTSHAAAFLMVEKIYGPIHKLAVKKRVNSASPLGERLHQLELTWIATFEANKSWHSAYKALVRINELPRAAGVLNSWAQEGYASEHALYFARAILQILADGHIAKSEELVRCASLYVVDRDDISPTDPQSASLAIYHFAVILSNLAAMEPKPRVDKVKIFGIITNKYAPLIQRIDPKLILLFEKLGQNAFGLKSVRENTNPMAALFQNMMAGAQAQKGTTGKKKASGGVPGLGGLDLNAMMSMMNALQGAGSR